MDFYAKSILTRKIKDMVAKQNKINDRDELDDIDSYFECVTACSIGEQGVECVTQCVETHLKGDAS